MKTLIDHPTVKTHLASYPVTLLTIDKRQTILTSEPEGLTLVLKAGYELTAETCFKHNPPTPYEIEHAITLVEDEIMLIAKQLPASTQLITSDKIIHDIALLSDVHQSEVMVLSIEALERTFNRFADIVSGRPATQENLPAEHEFATSLLILRELMHHLRFEQITIIN